MPSPARPGPADDIEDRDPGLARERTDLAWTRTAISFAGLGAAMLRTSAAAGAVIIVTGAAVWGLGQVTAREAQPAVRRQWSRRRRTRQWSRRRRTVQLVTVASTLTSVVALAVALLAPGHGYL